MVVYIVKIVQHLDFINRYYNFIKQANQNCLNLSTSLESHSNCQQSPHAKKLLNQTWLQYYTWKMTTNLNNGHD